MKNRSHFCRTVWALWWVLFSCSSAVAVISMLKNDLLADGPAKPQTNDSKSNATYLTATTRSLAATRPTSAATTTTAPVAKVTSVNISTTVPATAPSVAGTQPARWAVPTKAEQAKSRALIFTIFAEPMNDHSSAGKRKLVSELFRALPSVENSPVDQFTLLTQIVKAARDTSDLNSVVLATDLLSYRFEISSISIKSQALIDMSLNNSLPEINHANLVCGLVLLRQFITAQDVTSASRLATELRPLASVDKPMQTIFQSRIKDLEQLRTVRSRLVTQKAVLKKHPKDADACLFVGVFDCTYDDDWSTGLPLLTDGTDPALKNAALAELKPRVSAEDLVVAADHWWAFADKQPESVRAQVKHHAGLLYDRALPGTAGLRRKAIEGRIADLKLVESPGSPTLGMILSQIKANGWNTPDRSATCVAAPFSNLAGAVTGDAEWTANTSGYSFNGNVQIGNASNNHGGDWVGGSVRVDPGFYLQGGTLTASAGSLQLNGTFKEPIVLKNVQIVCEYGAEIKSTYTVFDHCTFSKGGSFHWNGGYSAKWEMTDCYFTGSNFQSLSRMDYGIKLRKVHFRPVCDSISSLGLYVQRR